MKSAVEIFFEFFSMKSAVEIFSDLFFNKISSGNFFRILFEIIEDKKFYPRCQPTLVIFLCFFYLLSNLKDKSHVTLRRGGGTKKNFPYYEIISISSSFSGSTGTSSCSDMSLWMSLSSQEKNKKFDTQHSRKDCYYHRPLVSIHITGLGQVMISY